MYARPLIRKRLGSASSGFINYTALYVVWLVSAAIYHVPGFTKLGIDIRADVSLLFVSFTSCVFALSGALGLKELLQRAGALPPSLPELPPSVGPQALIPLILLNSCSVALTCSSFYSFCSADGDAGRGDLYTRAKALLCTAMPQQASASPSQGCGRGASDLNTCAACFLGTQVPLQPLYARWSLPAAQGGAGDQSAHASPVLLMWTTLVALSLTNHLADILSLDVVLLSSKLYSLMRKGAVDPSRIQSIQDLNLMVALTTAAEEEETAQVRGRRVAAAGSAEVGSGAEGAARHGRRNSFDSKLLRRLDLLGTEGVPRSPGAATSAWRSVSYLGNETGGSGRAGLQRSATAVAAAHGPPPSDTVGRGRPPRPLALGSSSPRRELVSDVDSPARSPRGSGFFWGGGFSAYQHQHTSSGGGNPSGRASPPLVRTPSGVSPPDSPRSGPNGTKPASGLSASVGRLISLRCVFGTTQCTLLSRVPDLGSFPS